MAEIQPTTTTTPNPSSEIKEAVGKNTKWNGKLLEPPLKGRERSRISVEESLAKIREFYGLSPSSCCRPVFVLPLFNVLLVAAYVNDHAHD
jgi:hypothetical protein